MIEYEPMRERGNEVNQLGIPKEREAVARTLIDLFLRALVSEIQMAGRENIPQDNSSAYIVAMNHLGWVEGLVLLKVFPRWIHWMAKEESFNSQILGPFFRFLTFFPVRRGEVDRQALRTAFDLLGANEILGMAPEGTRGREEEFGVLKKAKEGVIYIAHQSRVPIIPVAVWGTETIFPLIEENGLKIEELVNFRRPEVSVNIGEPFTDHLEQDGRPLGREERQGLTTGLMLRIRDLLPEKYHGFYAGTTI